ncbi:MAG: S-layer homology domain-containing protein [Acidobacteriota bacterium]
MKRIPVVGFGMFLATLASGGALAQEVPRGGESYGPGANYLVIPSAAFMPDTQATTYSVSSNGYITTSLGATFRAPVDLPAGASVVNVCAFTYDNDAAFNVGVQWEAREMGDSDANPKEALLGITSTPSSGAPGYALTCVPLASPTLIRKFQDLDGDGHSHFSWYRVSVSFGGGQTGFGGAVITWLRTVSPAPASATFGDVPTNFLYFRAIEALAASGITAGCGGGNFCPNGTVTRGEMAAFLARALGLHWPL